jgi:aldehyde dehydrogenase (NAD+)
MAYLKHADSLYIDGEFVRAPNSEPIINPADESLIMMAPVGT